MAYAKLSVLVDAIGLPPTLALCRAFGGTRIYTARPETVIATHRLAVAIGVDAARQLASLYPGESIDVPLGARLLRAQRDQAIVNDAEELSISRLARKYGLNERSVRRVLAKRRGVSR